MNLLQSSYYGDNTRWFIGKAKTTINDPKNLGRIRVRVFGLHTDDMESISDTDLPWANTMLSSNVFNGSSYQAYGINDGDTVFGIFLDGKHSQSPLVLGVIPTAGENVDAVPDEADITDALRSQNEIISDGTIKTDVIANSNMASYMPTGVSMKDIPAPTGSPIQRGGVQISETLKQQYCEVGFKFFSAALKERGSMYPHEQAAGLIGNFLAESGMNPTIKAFGTEDSWGIAQWNAKGKAQRLQKLKNFANAHKLKWNTLEPQLKYTIHELETTPLGSLAGGININTYMAQTSVADATRHILDRYENPNYVEDYYKSKPNPSANAINNYNKEFNKRFSFAQDIYNSFTKG